MTQKSLSKLLKALIITVGVFGAAMLFYAANVLFTVFEELAPYIVPFLGICIIPCYAVLIYSWGVAKNIGNDKSFSYSNAKFLKYNAVLATCDTLFFTAGTLALLLLKKAPATFWGIAVIVVFFGVAASIVFASLSHLVFKAAELQEQSDLTV